MFVVVKTAGSNVGRVRSVHRHSDAAENACPRIFFTVRNVGDRRYKKGDVIAEIIANYQRITGHAPLPL